MPRYNSARPRFRRSAWLLTAASVLAATLLVAETGHAQVGERFQRATKGHPKNAPAQRNFVAPKGLTKGGPATVPNNLAGRQNPAALGNAAAGRPAVGRSANPAVAAPRGTDATGSVPQTTTSGDPRSRFNPAANGPSRLSNSPGSNPRLQPGATDPRLRQNAGIDPRGGRPGGNDAQGRQNPADPRGRFNAPNEFTRASQSRRFARPAERRERPARPVQSGRCTRRDARHQRPADATARARLPQPPDRSARLPPHAAGSPPDEFHGAGADAGPAVFRRARVHRRPAGGRDPLRHQRDGVPRRRRRAARPGRGRDASAWHEPRRHREHEPDRRHHVLRPGRGQQADGRRGAGARSRRRSVWRNRTTCST